MIIKISLNDISISLDDSLIKNILRPNENGTHNHEIIIYGIKYSDELMIRKFIMNCIMNKHALNGANDWIIFVDKLDIIPLVTFMEFLKKFFIEPKDTSSIDITHVFAKSIATRIFRLERLYQYIHYGPFNISDQISDHSFLEASLIHYINKADKSDLFSTGLNPVQGKMFIPVRGAVCTREHMDINIPCFAKFFTEYIGAPGLQYLAHYARELKVASGSHLFYSNMYAIDYSLHYYFYCYCSAISKTNISMDPKTVMYYYNLWARKSSVNYTSAEKFSEDIVNYLKLIKADYFTENSMIHFKNPYYFTDGLDTHVRNITKGNYSFHEDGPVNIMTNLFNLRYNKLMTLSTLPVPKFDRFVEKTKVAQSYVHPQTDGIVIPTNWPKSLMSNFAAKKPADEVQLSSPGSTIGDVSVEIPRENPKENVVVHTGVHIEEPIVRRKVPKKKSCVIASGTVEEALGNVAEESMGPPTKKRK